MALSGEKCNFCDNNMIVPQRGWRLSDSTFAKLCVPCVSAFRQGTFCYQYHKDEDGWRKCDGCEREIHCGCIMALHTYELNDACGVTCNVCLGKKGLLVPVSGASTSAPILTDCSQLNYSCRPENVTGVELSADFSRLYIQAPDELTPEQIHDQSQLANSNIRLLFEKRLTPSDCDFKAGRILLPTQHAEKLVALPLGQRKMPVVIKDTSGAFWKFKLRWWPNRRSKKYVLDGTKRLYLKLQWHAGDILKFYRQNSDGMLIMVLHRVVSEGTSSTAVPLVADAPKLGT